MRARVAFIVVLGVVLSCCKVFAQDVDVFSNYVGEFSVEIIVKPNERAPDGQTLEGTLTTQYALNGRYLEIRSDIEYNPAIRLVTYDVPKKQLHMWRFTRENMEESWGQLDSATNEIVWSNNDKSRFDIETRWKVIDDATIHWVTVQKDKEGNLLAEIVWKLTRTPEGE